MKISELFGVEGRAALVTGGASGIGYACAEVLAENGARVCIVDCDAEKLRDAEARLTAIGPEIMALTADASDLAQMERVVAMTIERFGRLDIAFINAGIGGGPGFLDMAGRRNPIGAVEGLEDRFWYDHVANNLTSVFVSLKCVVPPMRAQRSGSIIVTTSVAALKVENFVCTPYLVAKAGAAHLMHQVALELAKDNVRVNAIAPGSFVTGIGGGRMAEPEVQKRFAAANPMGRMARPNEIKGLALFLASPASSYVTGAQLAIDGGGSLGLADPPPGADA
jgi:NAD(P)-dependent dehydrogenase (short-subunit alcohol dehydrogenase family)